MTNGEKHSELPQKTKGMTPDAGAFTPSVQPNSIQGDDSMAPDLALQSLIAHLWARCGMVFQVTTVQKLDKPPFLSWALVHHPSERHVEVEVHKILNGNFYASVNEGAYEQFLQDIGNDGFLPASDADDVGESVIHDPCTATPSLAELFKHRPGMYYGQSMF